jgi:aerobic carbon-monoxide dehydrogenase medium subunit
MYAFKYQKAVSIDAAAASLAAAPQAKLMAGGQSLIAAMKLRLADVGQIIDLGAIKGLSDIKVEANTVTIGAMTRHAEVAASAEVRSAIPALATLAGGIADRMVRNMGTIGGSVANNDPAADYPAGLLALGASVVTNRRRILADDFFTGMFETALESGEIVTAVTFPVPTRAAYMKFKNPASRYAIVGVFVADFGGSVRVAVTGAGPAVFRVSAMEQALTASFLPSAIAGLTIPQDGLNSDIHAPADYRAHLIKVMAMRAVETALK